MNDLQKNNGPLGPPDLTRLLAQYLKREAGSVQASVCLPGEVVPHEASVAQPVDPRLAQEGAGSVFRYYQPEFRTLGVQFSPEWQSLVANVEPQLDVPFAAGNFPQLVRDLQSLFRGNASAGRNSNPAGGPPAMSLMNWVASQQEPLGQLLAAGLLRLGRYFAQADETLARVERGPPPELLPALTNERAALAWQRGETEEAAELWTQQSSAVPSLFNRGMAALFLGRTSQARAPLRQAVAQIPEADPWHHLGQLYLALAEIRQ
jgi:tetratricopeptide (TPR) repeat protein